MNIGLIEAVLALIFVVLGCVAITRGRYFSAILDLISGIVFVYLSVSSF